jgi:hypothetical protein
MPKQLSIEATARSTGSRHDVFRLLADSTTWPRWTPFTDVSLIEQAPDGGEGVGAVKQTRFRGMTGRERIVSFTPDRQLSYVYIKGALGRSIRDYVAVVDLDDAGDGGTSIRWHSTFYARFPGSGWLPRRSLAAFIQKCADGLASAAGDDGRSR